MVTSTLTSRRASVRKQFPAGRSQSVTAPPRQVSVAAQASSLTSDVCDTCRALVEKLTRVSDGQTLAEKVSSSCLVPPVNVSSQGRQSPLSFGPPQALSPRLSQRPSARSTVVGSSPAQSCCSSDSSSGSADASLVKHEDHEEASRRSPKVEKWLSERACLGKVPARTLPEAGLDVVCSLGHGNQSTVHLARRVEDGSFRCVKRFCKESMVDTTRQFLKMEFEVMTNLGAHPRIAQAFKLFQDKEFFHMEMEYYPGGDFGSLEKNARAAGMSLLSEQWWGKVFKQCLQSLAHLHRHGIMHCDVKEQNLMVKNTNYLVPEVVLIDFGVAQEANNKRDVIYGTPGYIPPEVWETKIWQPQSDAFSLGVVILQMLIGRVPNTDDRCGIFVSNAATYKEVRNATETFEPPFQSISVFHRNLKELVRQLLDKDSRLRPSPTFVLSSGWISSLDEKVEQDELAPNLASDDNVVTPRRQSLPMNFRVPPRTPRPSLPTKVQTFSHSRNTSTSSTATTASGYSAYSQDSGPPSWLDLSEALDELDL